MKLLISPSNEKEAIEAITGGADIIDVKNPAEGALGANYPWVIKKIRELTPKNLEVSCTLGEVPNLPGSISLAALGAASLGVDYIKVGLYGLKTPQPATSLLQHVNRAAKEYNPKIKVVAVAYAEASKIGAIDPLLVPEIAKNAKVEVAMIDTSVKDGKNTFDYLSIERVREFVDSAHASGLEVALAGSLRKQHIPLVHGLGAGIIGLRGAACTNNDRVSGKITRELVSELAKAVQQTDAVRT